MPLSLLQTLFFPTYINMPCMYQYSSSLILKLFLSYSFILSSQSLTLIISTNLLWTLTLMPNPSYAELLCIFDSLTLHLVFTITHLVHPQFSNSGICHASQLCVVELHTLNSILFTPDLTLHLPTSQTQLCMPNLPDLTLHNDSILGHIPSRLVSTGGIYINHYLCPFVLLKE